MRGCVVGELAAHGFEVVADFFESGAEHAERVVGDDAEDYGAHAGVGGFFLCAFFAGEDDGCAVWVDVCHAWVGQEPECDA